ncbi:flagellar export protein FliJ [Paenibacillus sp. HB172176]|uniref:flagellar export protein FliJ n=1 Tax=Paenibacillus sp. HB172176 TaxID=2493690 RepID=UPI001F0F83D8|nr:flagellar export protein FliJ [Paenibacillus sp. HB172176]
MFQYSFQKVVDLKKSQKTQAEWLLSNALSLLSAQEASLNELQQAKADWEAKLQSASAEGVPLSEIVIIREYLDHVQACIEKKLLQVEHAQHAVEQSRSRLSDKMKDEKVWLKAKDNAFHTYRQEMSIKEQNELDEMATVRFKMGAQ